MNTIKMQSGIEQAKSFAKPNLQAAEKGEVSGIHTSSGGKNSHERQYIGLCGRSRPFPQSVSLRTPVVHCGDHDLIHLSAQRRFKHQPKKRKKPGSRPGFLGTVGAVRKMVGAQGLEPWAR
jgi:hypothetical protein